MKSKRPNESERNHANARQLGCLSRDNWERLILKPATLRQAQKIGNEGRKALDKLYGIYKEKTESILRAL